MLSKKPKEAVSNPFSCNLRQRLRPMLMFLSSHIVWGGFEIAIASHKHLHSISDRAEEMNTLLYKRLEMEV